MEGEPSQPPNSSWPLSQNGTNAEATPAANLTFSSYYQHTSPVAAMFIVAYALIFLLCMVGNTLVCFIVLKNRHMRTVTNMFILNLAVSDLLVGIFCMPTTLVDNLITGWPFDNATCKMSGLVQGMSVSASVFTLVAIAVERFRCIVYPFREKLTLRKALVTIAVIWALALLIMCPSAVTLTVIREEHHFMVDARNRSYPLYSCWEAWPEKGMRKVYTTVLFSHIYLAPLALIVVMYARIARKLCQAPGPARGGEEAADGGLRGAGRAWCTCWSWWRSSSHCPGCRSGRCCCSSTTGSSARRSCTWSPSTPSPSRTGWPSSTAAPTPLSTATSTRTSAAASRRPSAPASASARWGTTRGPTPSGPAGFCTGGSSWRCAPATPGCPLSRALAVGPPGPAASRCGMGGWPTTAWPGKGLAAPTCPSPFQPGISEVVLGGLAPA
uniref:Neuropeptide FF receptor 1 n=1 Tax=Macaca fascicularis TaxID=9541 RepID=A0A2K5VEL4_MACFA